MHIPMEKLLISVAMIVIIGVLVSILVPNLMKNKKPTPLLELAERIVNTVVFVSTNGSFIIPNVVFDNSVLNITSSYILKIELLARAPSLPGLEDSYARLHYINSRYIVLDIVGNAPIKQYGGIPIRIWKTQDQQMHSQEKILTYSSNGRAVSIVPVVQIYYSNSTAEEGNKKIHIYHINIVVPEFLHIVHGDSRYRTKVLKGIYDLIFNLRNEVITVMPAEFKWLGGETSLVMKLTLLDDTGKSLKEESITLVEKMTPGSIIVLYLYKICIEVSTVLVTTW